MTTSPYNEVLMPQDEAQAVPFDETEENTNISPQQANAIAKLAGLTRKAEQHLALSEQDVQAVNVAKMTLENAQLKYQLFVTQLFSKYNLSEKDTVQADGTIVRASK